MKKWIHNWNLVRILQLIFCVFIAVQGIYDKDWMLLLFAALLSLMPILNLSCCMRRSCNVPSANKNKNTPKDITYEEVH